MAVIPERGKANEAVVEVLAEWLGVRESQLEIAKGHSQPRKTVSIEGLTPETLKTLMERLV